MAVQMAVSVSWNKSACLLISAVILFILARYYFRLDHSHDLKSPENMSGSSADLLHGGKINRAGEYQQFCGFTIVSSCHDLESLKYLEDFITNSRALRKVITPLPYTSYHMTTYGIYANTRKPLKFVQDWLNGDPSRSSTHKKCIPTEDVYPIMKRAQQVWDKCGKEQITVKSGKLNLGTSALTILVTITDEELVWRYEEARVQTDEMFDKKSTFPHYHISLGYFYSKVEDLSAGDRVTFNEELEQLQKLLPTTFTINPPLVTSFSSMKEFVPIVKE